MCNTFPASRTILQYVIEVGDYCCSIISITLNVLSITAKTFNTETLKTMQCLYLYMCRYMCVRYMRLLGIRRTAETASSRLGIPLRSSHFHIFVFVLELWHGRASAHDHATCATCMIAPHSLTCNTNEKSYRRESVSRREATSNQSRAGSDAHDANPNVRSNQDGANLKFLYCRYEKLDLQLA